MNLDFINQMNSMAQALINCNHNMHKLVLRHGVLSPGFNPILNHNVHHLELCNMMLKTHPLFELSSTFESLSCCCCLDECRFDSEDTDRNDPNTFLNISLSNTRIETLKVITSSRPDSNTCLQKHNIFFTVGFHQDVRFFIIKQNGTDVKSVTHMAFGGSKIDLIKKRFTIFHYCIFDDIKGLKYCIKRYAESFS